MRSGERKPGVDALIGDGSFVNKGEVEWPWVTAEDAIRRSP